MPRYRTLPPDLWKHRVLRRAPVYVGWLYAYLITTEADDEGRFLYAPEDITEDCFSLSHGIDVDAVKDGIEFLHSAGLVLIYEHGGQQFGHLTGWYEHQYIQADRRQSSALPPPPCEVYSWDVADAIRNACAKARNVSIRKVTYQEALRWHGQTGYLQDNRLPEWKPKGRIGYPPDNPGITGGYPEVEKEVEKEGEVTPPPVETDDTADTSYLQQEWPSLRNAIWALNIPKHLKERWLRQLVNAITGEGDAWLTSEDQVLELLARYPPKSAEENLPSKWLERVEKNTGGSDPDARAEAALAAYQAQLDAEWAENERMRKEWEAAHPKEARA